MVQEDKQTFRQYCENDLSQRKFNSLYKIADATKNSITRAINNPNTMSFNLLEEFSKTLEMPAIELVKRYECSLDVMTAREYMSILD